MSRYTFISCDCHAAPPMREYRSFVAAAHREAFDDWLAQSRREAVEARRGVPGRLRARDPRLDRVDGAGLALDAANGPLRATRMG